MENMKLTLTLLLFFGASTVDFGQSLSSAPFKVVIPHIPVKPANLEAQEDFAYEEITADLVFDKMAEVEAFVFTRQEIEAINTQVIYTENDLHYFE